MTVDNADRHGMQTTACRNTSRHKFIPWLCAALIGGLMFAVNFTLTLKFDQLGVFDEPNTLFHADPMWRLQSFSSGYGWNDRTLVHPNLGNFFSIPIRLAAKVCCASGICQGDEEDLRVQLALPMVPGFAAATVVIVFALLHLSGLSLPQSVLISVVGASSFSQLIFGSIPDHFALAGFGIASAFFLGADLLRNEGHIRWIAWTGLGVLMLGITITNALWIGIVFCTCQLFAYRDWKPVLRYSLVWTVLVLLISVVIAEVGARAYRQRDLLWSFGHSTKFVEKHLTDEGIFRLEKAPAALVNTFSPSTVGTTQNELAEEGGFGREYRFTVDESASVLPMLVVIPLIILGTIGCLFGSKPLRPLAVASLLIIALNLGMHAVFGDEYFLYSQQWLVPLLVLLAGNFCLSRRFRIWATTGLVVMQVLMLANNTSLLYKMFSTLAADTSG